MADREEPVAEYDYATKMRMNREVWASLGIKQTTALIPTEDHDKLRAIAAAWAGRRLLQLVYNNEAANYEEVLSMIANKRPTQIPSKDEILAMQIWMGAQDDFNPKDLDPVLDSYDELMKAKASSIAAQQAGDDGVMIYSFALEYALSYLIRGTYDVARMGLKV